MRKWDFKSGLKSFFLRSVLGWSAAIMFGAAGLFVARLFNLPKLPAAGLALGLFGLAGGVAMARLLQSAGGRVQPPQVWLLAVAWALCCMGGAFPLFLTMGTRPEMAIRAFYSFAICGAAGGLVTSLALRRLFPDHAQNDVIPGTFLWSLTFGLSAVAVDAAGEWLPSVLPPSLAQATVFILLAVILGFGGGCAIRRFFKSDRGAWPALQAAKRDGTLSAGRQKIRSLWVLIILAAPFYLNDLSNIYVKDWRLWLLIDYTSIKLFPFLVMAYLIRNRTFGMVDFIGPRRQSLLSFLSAVAITVLAILFIEQNGALLLKTLFRESYPGSIPEIPHPFWRWIDLSAGLLMVGIFEEVVFRGYLHTFLRQYTRRASVFILFSAVSFGLIHWSGGLHQIIPASAAGAVFMAMYLRTYSLPAVILGHFIINFVDMAGVIPPSLFCFFSMPPLR